MTTKFGQLLKDLRLRKKLTLREFCARSGIDAGNYSRIERGLFPPPQKEEILSKYATALGLKRGSDEWIEFFDVATVARGEIPRDLLNDEEVVNKLPILFRTLRGSPIPTDKMDDLVEIIRKG